MDNYKTILIAIDGSKQSEKAFSEGLALAVVNNASVILAWIINEDELAHSAFAYSKILREEKEHVEKEMLKKIHDAEQIGVHNVSTIIEIGNPKEYLASVIPDSQNIDLIVMGPTGKGMIQQTLVGSTTSYVVNNTTCSVLVVR